MVLVILTINYQTTAFIFYQNMQMTGLWAKSAQVEVFSLNFTQKFQPLICHASINFYCPPIYCYFIPYLHYQYTKFTRLRTKLDINFKVNNHH